MAYRDWRSPGENWIKTASGWKHIASTNTQLHPQFNSDNSSESTRAKLDVKDSNYEISDRSCTSKESEDVNKKVLHQRCILVGSTSRESHNYSTVTDAINELKFEQVLEIDQCFPFVGQVIALVFEQAKLSGSMQNTLLRLTDRAKDICIASKKNSDLVLKMMAKAILFFEKLRQDQITDFGVKNIDGKLKSVLKMKFQLQSNLFEDQSQHRHQSLELTDLPVDCLQHIASYLIHPRDLLSFGATNMKLYQICEDSYMWKMLTVYHYGLNDCQIVDNWKEMFIAKYRKHGGQLKYGFKCKRSAIVCRCSSCDFVFWKEYGHPCLGEAGINELDHQPLTAKQFLQLFVF